MTIENLVGKVAIRTAQTVYGGSLFLCEPVLVLSYINIKAQVCTLTPSDEYDAGVTLCLKPEYLDSNWVEYGSLLSQSVSTKAQIISVMLNILGITADNASFKLLCEAVSYKQLFSVIEEQLDLKDMINALRASDTPAKEDTVVPDTSSTSWNDLVNMGRLVKEGTRNDCVGY